MAVQYWPLVGAGVIGMLVAVAHGVLMQKLMVRPILAHAPLTDGAKRLVPLLLQYSTFTWFMGGVALIAIPQIHGPAATVTTALFVGAFYAYGAVGNAWGTRGKHPGWMLLALACGLIVYGILPLV